MYELSTFDNGLRLITVSMPNTYSATMGVYVSVGSRYERPELAGLSHFTEHMLFKGTGRRPTPRELASAIEQRGGYLNASTGRERTSYYARVAHDDLPIAADVLLDMLLNSRLSHADTERERQVILEEINESFDAPDDLVQMNFFSLLWPDHPLGWDIAGSRESVATITSADVQQHLHQAYTAARMVIAVAGPTAHETVRSLLAPMVGGWNGGDGLSAAVAPHTPGQRRVIVAHRPIEQVHLMLGLRALDRFDPDRHALRVLDTILSDGMSSRLFTDIREERGLAYTVYSSVMRLSDTGSFAIYASVEPRRTQEAVEALLGHLSRLREQPVSEEELANAKSLSRGRTLLSLEYSGSNAGWVGNQLLLRGSVATPEEALAEVEAVTAEEIQRVARRLFRDDRLVLSLVGPMDESEEWERRLRVE